MKNLVLLLGLIILLNASLVYAHSESDFVQAKELIDSGISCSELSEEQLESIGEYYMEQMHSGEAHEAMDEMMGGEGSESLKQMHINMARNNYCKENTMMNNNGMMNGMLMMSEFGNAFNSFNA
jgi:hypothetical protein